MKFKRIDMDTVRCLITEEELWENGLEIEDFLQNGKKAEEFFRQVIAQASEEVGYKIKGGNIAIQVSVLPDHRLALTFSEKQDTGILSMLENLKAAVEKLSNKTRASEQNEEDAGESVKQETTKDGSAAQILGQGKKRYELCFETLDLVERYCKAVSFELPIRTSLYKLERDQLYFLLMERDGMSDKQLCRLLGASLDFVNGIYAQDSVDSYIREQGSVLIEEHAVEVLQNL